ncbi:NYN domain-containing protein [Aliarcobacter butzleri]
MSKNNDKLVVLIDADNAQASILTELLAEISKYGMASIKRAYGDWTRPNLKSWKEHLHKHAIQPIQQFSYSTGKNSTDSALIIDAMDILHENKLDGFCIISSDSDFTRLATRIREWGLTVYGFGEEKTPDAFISACDKFIFTENLKPKNLKKPTTNDDNLKEILIKSIRSTSNDEGWVRLSNLAAYISKNEPSFDPRNYGYEKYGVLVRNLNYLEIQEEKFTDGSTNVHILVKIKE